MRQFTNRMPGNRTKFVLAPICLLLAPLMHANTITLTLDGTFSPPDYEFYSYTDTTGTVQNNIPIDPYITYLNGSTYNNSLAYTFCFDFFSPTDIGTPYDGTFATPTDFASMESTYLINLLNGLGLINAPLATRGAISTAIWEIMNPSSKTGQPNFPSDPAAQPYEQQAAAAVTSGAWTTEDSARYPMWVPSANNSNVQRFGVVFAGELPTPEPASQILIGCGLVALGLIGRKRNTSN